MSAAHEIPAIPTVAEIREWTLQHFGRRPCLWQCNVAVSLLWGNRDLVCISATCSGKTLTFWMPLLFRPDGIQVIITPLNILGEQNTLQLQQIGVKAISISGLTANANNFEVFKLKGGFAKLWRNPAFRSRLISVIWDEAHCVKSWEAFRKGYKEAGRLRNLLSGVPYYMPSAMLPEPVLDGVLSNLHVQKSRLETIRKMQHAASTFMDLVDILLPPRWKPGDRIPKFLAFFDNIKESHQAADVLQAKFPAVDRYKVLCFHSDMTASLRGEATAEYADGQLWGLYCTDSFGMWVDIADIEVVVQWRLTCDFNTLWQRLGHAARGQGREAVAVLLVEPKYFDEEREASTRRAEKRAEKRKEAVAQKAVAVSTTPHRCAPLRLLTGRRAK
ncbi:P-loop containing nucleoside triphosphate hydrolase protein [Trametes coccinea BRFM310]|uniref:DNA 3'-5' helicase n=1 Tax=Trametes coccinea (strain BRFM310) TaxID=1353009 RepID=A0A1Y2IVU9_TRAC3|nr:P-loop containing nucleoside triphosphate hydrolase protein [Trametes coccinea BRFM310]